MRKLYFFLIGFGFVAAVALLAEVAHAQDCGYNAAYAYIASQATGCSATGSLHECKAYAGPIAASGSGQACLSGLICVMKKSKFDESLFIYATFSNCNCAARPDWTNPSGPRSFYDSMDGSGDVKKCMAGCTLVPKGNYAADKWMATGTPGGKYAAFAPDGWRHDGSQCDPNAPGSGPDPTGSNCRMAGDAEICVERKPDPPKPPKVCLQYQGQEICSDDPNACKGGSAVGFLCAGNPAPDPPPPPTGPQAPPRTPDIDNPCIINGVPCDVKFWKPPFGDAPCPAGQTRNDQGNCVPDEGDPPPPRCPDGRPPQNGACPAPYADCADGTRPTGNPPRCYAPMANCPDGSVPIRGGCPAVDGVCPDGSQPVNGRCTAQYGLCPNGQPPNAGQCTPGFANCPNGAQPVNGQCSVGGACDPATDPAGCEGADEGNAGGGGTCAAEPFCSGDLILCNVLSQQWRTRCAVEALAGDGTEPTEADYGTGGTQADVWGTGDGTGAINGAGWIGGGGGACPDMGSVSFMGHAYAISDWVPCAALRILAALILAGGFAQAAYIIGRG